jgi:hypothetical protein
VLAFLLISSRRPDALLNPQFYFEDGNLWYTQAHEMGGLNAALAPARGYFQSSARLGAWLAQGVALRWAPLVMNLLAISLQTLPAVLLASRRFTHLVPRLPTRLLLALLYLGLPNSWTTIANLTHSQWYLAVLGCLIVLARPEAGRGWRVFDVGGVALSGLSGPFAIFLAPVAGLLWWARRQPWTAVLLGVTLATALIQAASVLLTSTGAGQKTLAASTPAFFTVLARQLGYAIFFGQTGLGWIVSPSPGILAATGAMVTVGAGMILLLVFAALEGPLELRLFILFSSLVLAASLVWPPIPGPWWELLANPGMANRYFLIPSLAVVATLVWLCSLKPLAFRIIGAAALATLCVFGMRLDWRQPALRDYDFREYARRYEQAAAGDKVQISYPPGWTMMITKK